MGLLSHKRKDTDRAEAFLFTVGFVLLIILIVLLFAT